MPLTRLDNLISSKTGKYLYVSPDDFNASDALDNRGTSPTRPFLTIQRAFLEVARFSYVPGPDNDRFDQFTILLSPGTHYIDNRPGDATATSVPIFNYSAGEWNDTTSFDLSDPNNVLRRFNSVEGGCIIPRGTSLVGTDLRRTQVRPLYVPDPADKDIGRTSLFQVTGGCYFWQFTILDGDLTVNSPLWNSVENIGKVYSQPDSSVLSIPEYSHHKITNFVFARKEDLGALYAKVAKAFSAYQPTIDDPGEFDYRIQENRIVGPLSDSVTIESIQVDNITTGPSSGTADITVNTKINHGFFVGQYVAITGMNAGQGKLNGVWKVKSISSTNLKEFVFNVPYNAAGLGLVPSGATWTESTTPVLSSTGTTASVQAEVDSVESASPYVFNVSIRSTWGICGIWADGSRATGFKSMVIAQYTGVSLQKDDRAFIRYDEFTNTWNQANLQDAFSSTPYHIDGTAYWKDDWRNFHVRASEDAFIQNVSIFAVGFADHFLMESGGDMSITNSNSNFGNTSLHAIGYKNYSFNQDKGGYISHIVPPKKLLDTDIDVKNYYTLNVTLSNDVSNVDRLYYGIDEASDPTDRPSSSIDGFKLGGKSGEKLYVKLDAVAGESGKQVKSSIVTPNGVKKWSASLTALSPTGQIVGDLDGDGDSDDAQDIVQYNLRQDAANLIDSNKAFIQSEAFGYILEKYPSLQSTPYVNPGVTGDTNRYRDASNLIRSNRQEIVDRAFAQISLDYDETSWGTDWVVPGDTVTTETSRFKDAYRLIQKNRDIIAETALAAIQTNFPAFVYPGANTTERDANKVKCRRDIGHFIDAVSLDIVLGGGNKYTRKFILQYFDGAGSPITGGLQGEEAQSNAAFSIATEVMKAALTNSLTTSSTFTNSTYATTSQTVVVSTPYNGSWLSGSTTGTLAIYQDTSITAGPASYGGSGGTVSNTSASSCADVRSALDSLTTIITGVIAAGNTSSLVAETAAPLSGTGETKCKRDIGYIVDALISDLYNGANSASIDAARAYFTSTTTSTTTPSTSNATASVTSTQLSGTLPSTLFPAAGTSGQNPDVSWSFSLPTELTNAGVSITSYDLLLEDLHEVDINGFPQIHWKVDDIPNTVTSIPTNAAQLNIPGATFRPSYLGSPNTTGVSSVGYSGPEPGSENHTYRLTIRANLSNSSSTVVTSLQFNHDSSFSAPTVDGSFSLPRTTTRPDNLQVNYNVVTVINAGTPISGGLVGEEAQSVVAFNKIAIEAKKALTNQLYVKDLTILPDPTTGSNTSSSSCANVQTTVDSLISIVITAISNGNLTSLPPRNGGSWLGNSKCRRDIGYIVEAVTSDLRLGGNENVVNAAEAYYVGTNLDYINNELNETLDAYNYVRDLSIAAMRNWSFEIQNASTTNGSAVVTVASTVGIVMGMRVTGTGIPANSYVKRIISGTTFELGDSDSRLTIGNTVNATSTSTTTTLTLTLDAGIWAEIDNLAPLTDSSVIVDTNYPECAGVATAITTYFAAISTILNSGLGTVSRSPATVSGSSISTRATLFTLTEVGGISSTNPHNLETGTPVRLVPRAVNETVDKKVVRLPKGFDSNTKYYVISPGRSTEPFDFSNYTSPSGNVPFDGSAGSQQAIMLATSIENANAGIYIYSPETESVDPGVVIEIHQYVQDVDYDLVQYRCSLVPGSNSVFSTEGPHGFDKQQTNTTPQKVFFRGGSQTPDISGSVLPTRTTGGVLPDNIEYFIRYVPPMPGQARNTRFTIHTSHSDAINGTNEVTFSNSGTSFYVFSNKRRSPIRFAPEANLIDVRGNRGSWYINTSSSDNGIIDRLHLPVYDDSRGKTRTTDTWFERVKDEREISDTIYRLRYVIPKDGNYREPINGFVFKIRTDETRRLLPQKILLRPIGAASSFANVTKNGERLGLTTAEQINGGAYNTANPNFISTYDPYADPFTIETDSDIAFSVQSAKKVTISGSDYLELTVFDVSILDPALKTSIFTTVKVDTPQGGTGNFITGSNITWSGNSSGSGVVHAWFPTHNYLIIRNAIGELNYSSSTAITFTQGSVTARMIEEKDGGKSDRSKYLYAVEGANVYTLTPGDSVTLPVTTGGTAQYRIDSVEDVSDIENTYYVFKSETIRKRIKGQQDGVYYITAIRGDISPFPTGSGVGINFRNFKFSQPVSRIYPLQSKNDPLWFQVNDFVVNQDNPNRDITILDPPETVSSADNYVHGYVSVNDAKRSVTREAILDLTTDPGIGIRTYTNQNRIQAKEGGASAGSEARLIPIVGDSDFPTEQRVYVELRRPSIARSGNHTFEYLGFGPGNYSTGFPARQQVILTDVQDFYAQAKKQDAGIVLYTGLNSSGDLYIGNRKINAITGEETLLDAPIIEEENEEVGISGALVTTFDDPVTFNNTVTFNYNQVIPATLSVVNIGVPVLINSEAVNTSGAVIRPPLSIQNYTAEATQEEYDPLRNGLTETMSFGNNIATFGVWRISARGSQTYSIRTNKNNITPNTQPTTGAPYNNFYNTSQLLNTTNGNWGNVPPKPGTILYKGSQVNYSGSLGWIYANDYTTLTTTGITPQVTTIQTFVGYTVVKVSFSATLGALGIKPDTQFRTTNSSNAVLNSGVDGIPFSIPVTVLIDATTAGGVQISEAGYPGTSSNYIWLSIAPNAAVSSNTELASALNINVSVSNSFWKEVGIIGSEAIRTETQSLGDYKVGVNTLARASDTAYQNAFVETQVYPAANLDVEGNAFISGKATASSINSGGTNTKTITNVDHALLVGGEYATPTNTATLRVSRTDNASPTTTYQTGGRVGINVPFADLDRNLTVRGNGRITGDFKFENNIEVNGTTTATSATLSTTNSTFNLINQNATTLNFGGAITTGNIFNTATSSQTLNIGTAVTGNTTLNIHSATGGATINIASNNTATSANIQLGNIGNSSSNTSLITIGGAFDSPPNSIFTVRNAQTILAGSLEVNGGVLQTDANGTSAFPLQLWTRAGASTYVDAFTRAVQLRLGAVAGTTTIRNQLEVKSDVNFFGDVIMNGGNNSGQLTVARGQLGTTAISHSIGSINSLNVDYYRRVEEITSVLGIDTLLDTVGVATLSATATLITVQTSQNGAGTQPGTIQNASTGVDPLLNINIGDYLLIDSEILRVIAPGPGTNPSTGSREIPVERGADCTTPATHLDNTVIYKLDKTIDASYITANINSTTTSVNLGEFGGIFEVNDYLRLSSTNTCPSGEFVRITAVNTSDAEDFRINDGNGNDRFVVDSVCGGLTSTLTSTCDFTIQLTTNDNQFIITSDTAGTQELTISRDGSILQIGDGTLAAPAAKYDGTGSASLTGDLLITSTNALDTALNNGRFKLTQSSGDLDIAGGIDMDGDLKIYNGSTGINFSGTPNFQVLGASGNISTIGSITVTNSGTEVFQVNNDGSVDIAGIEDYFTNTGGRRTIYLTSGTTLESNITYLVNLGSDTQFLLPSAPQTGDMIRFIDIGGTLTYSRSMIIRAQSNHRIQGDNTGSKAGSLPTAYANGGELIVQTRNAAFGLVYAGATDTAGTLIPAAAQGWWIMEI